MNSLDWLTASSTAFLAAAMLFSAAILVIRRSRGAVPVYPDSWTPLDHLWLRRARIISGAGSVAAVVLSALVAARMASRGTLYVDQNWKVLFSPLLILAQWMVLSAPMDWSKWRLISPRTSAKLAVFVVFAAGFYYVTFFMVDALTR